MYIAHPTYGAGTRPHRTQLKTAARKTTLNAGQCVRQPREGRGRNRQAPPPEKKKRRGEGEKARKQPTAAKPPANTTTGGQIPPRRHRRQDPHRGTGGPPTQNRQHQASNSGPRGKGTPKRTKKKKRATSPARKKGDGGTGTTRSETEKKRKKRKNKSAINTPRQPSQKGLGTAGTRAQHTRPHRTPEPETAGGKRGAHETTHVPKASRNQSPTTNTTNGRH